MLGKGNYSEEHDAVHDQTGARSSVLIVLAGNNGDGFSCKMTQADLKNLPKILRVVADTMGPELEADLKKIEAIKKGEQDAKSTTEDSESHGFAGLKI